MNIKELYEALKEKGLEEEKELRVQFRDDGGSYYGYDTIGDEDYDYMYYDEKDDAVYL